MLSITATVVGGAGGIWARPNPCPPPPWLPICTSSVVTNMTHLLSKSFGGTADRYSIAALSAAFLQLLSLSVCALGESSTGSWSLKHRTSLLDVGRALPRERGPHTRTDGCRRQPPVLAIFGNFSRLGQIAQRPERLT